MLNTLIRTATLSDADQLVEIYRPYVEKTAISFEMEVPSVVEFSGRIENSLSKYSYLVAEIDGEIVGYAYGSAHREREAYASSVETSVYLNPAFHRQGIARKLYSQLFLNLKNLGYASAYAGITLPNNASVGFHQSFGFKEIGVFPKVGYKFDQWQDVIWLYRSI